MRPGIVALLVVLGLAAGIASAGDPAPPPPKTVKALRYRPKLVESTMDMIHGGGQEVDELWFPERNVVANVTTIVDPDVKTGETLRVVPVMHAFTSPKRTSQTDLATKQTKELATEEVEVPLDLAERIFELADLTDRQTKLAREHGLKASESGLFRASPPPRKPR